MLSIATQYHGIDAAVTCARPHSVPTMWLGIESTAFATKPNGQRPKEALT